MFKLMGKKIMTILGLTGPVLYLYASCCNTIIYSLARVFFILASCFVCFVALRPKSTAMVMVGQSVHLTTIFSKASLNK